MSVGVYVVIVLKTGVLVAGAVYLFFTRRSGRAARVAAAAVALLAFLEAWMLPWMLWGLPWVWLADQTGRPLSEVLAVHNTVFSVCRIACLGALVWAVVANRRRVKGS